MEWYTKYLSIFGLTLSEIPGDTLSEIGTLLHEKQSDTPLVSVVVIAHNEEPHILSCLWSLGNNEYSYPIEILVVNNHSTDRTEQALQAVGATYFNELKKGPGYARQCGLDHAKGRYHICIDADTMYPPHYIDTHVRNLMKPGVACTFSLWSFIPDKRHSRLGLWLYECLRDLHLSIQAIKRPGTLRTGNDIRIQHRTRTPFRIPHRHPERRRRFTGTCHEALRKTDIHYKS